MKEGKKNAVLSTMAAEIQSKRQQLLIANQQDLKSYQGSDPSLFDRLVIDDKKIDGMIQAINDVYDASDPVGRIIYEFEHPNGLQISNRTVPFGTIMVIYESRPDVTIEAAAIAFKAGNKIILKGGKEARHSNLILMKCWQQALHKEGQSKKWISYLDLDRKGVQKLLKYRDFKIDLIIPRGGEQLINFVREVAHCPVLVSGRGNNFMYVDKDADLHMAQKIIQNGKLSKMSACNAIDKVLIHKDIDPNFTSQLKNKFESESVEVTNSMAEEILYEEFLDYKIWIGNVNNLTEAIDMINKYSGGHSATIVTDDTDRAQNFLENVDCAAVYHNASTRFTDGGQMGLSAEIAISTEKLHHRGPLGLEQLVTNKWFCYGNGQIR